MLTKMKEKSQVTIPKPLVEQLGLKVGDSFEIGESDGIITLVPLELYPKPTMEKIRANMAKAAAPTEDTLKTIQELFGSMSGTSLSSDDFAASKQIDLELE